LSPVSDSGILERMVRKVAAAAAVVFVAVSLLLVVFFHPWTGLVFLAGAAVGVVIRYWIDARTEDRQRRLGIGAVVFGIVGLAAVAVTIFGATAKHSPNTTTPPAVRTARYAATIDERPTSFRVTEQFVLTPATVQAIGRHRLIIGLAADRPPWRVSELDSNTLVQRVRVAAHRGIRYWRPTTSLRLAIRALDFGRLIVMPSHSSTVLLKASQDLVAWTDPESSGGSTRAIALGTPGSFTAVGAVRVGARPQWARNPAAQKVIAFVQWGPYFWFFTLLLGVFGLVITVFRDVVQDWLKRLFQPPKPPEPAPSTPPTTQS